MRIGGGLVERRAQSRNRSQCTPAVALVTATSGSSSDTDDILFVVMFRELSEFSSHAARNTTPAGTSPMVTRRRRAMSNFRASATIIVLRFLPALSVLIRYQLANASVILEDQETPSQLDHPAAYSRALPALASPFFLAVCCRSRPAPPVLTSIARYSSSIPQLSRQDLMHQHVRSFDTNAAKCPRSQIRSASACSSLVPQ